MFNHNTCMTEPDRHCSAAADYTVRIIIINWNTRDLLAQCLSSIQEPQININIEIFVVDNGSSDGSKEMVRKIFPHIRLIENADNIGFAAANNKAMINPDFKYGVLLNSDTIVHGSVIEDTCRFMDTHPSVGLCGCKIINPDGSLQLSCRQYPSLKNLIFQLVGIDRITRQRYFARKYNDANTTGDAVDVDTISGCAMFVRRSALLNVGLLDEAFFFFGEETDWCRRLRQSGWRVAYAPTGQITHLGGASATKLNYRRDMMLTSAIVMLHRKHGGLLAASSAWAILFVFAFTRFILSTILYSISGHHNRKERRDHFLNIIKNYGRTWPNEKTYHP